MSEQSASDWDRLARIFDAIEESIATASNEEILEDLGEVGQDPGLTSARIRHIFAWELTQARKRNFIAAKEAYEQESKRLASFLGQVQLPDEPAAQRALLHRTLSQHPELTAQFRDFERLEEADVTSCLQQLAELGMLDTELETPE